MKSCSAVPFPLSWLSMSPATVAGPWSVCQVIFPFADFNSFASLPPAWSAFLPLPLTSPALPIRSSKDLTWQKSLVTVQSFSFPPKSVLFCLPSSPLFVILFLLEPTFGRTSASIFSSLLMLALALLCTRHCLLPFQSPTPEPGFTCSSSWLLVVTVSSSQPTAGTLTPSLLAFPCYRFLVTYLCLIALNPDF